MRFIKSLVGVAIGASHEPFENPGFTKYLWSFWLVQKAVKRREADVFSPLKNLISSFCKRYETTYLTCISS